MPSGKSKTCLTCRYGTEGCLEKVREPLKGGKKATGRALDLGGVRSTVGPAGLKGEFALNMVGLDRNAGNLCKN